MLNFTYININARNGKDNCRLGLTRHVAIELRLVEIPTHRIQHSLQRKEQEDEVRPGADARKMKSLK